MTDTIKLLESLSAIPGVSGDEGRVREKIINEIKNYCEYKIDPLGSLIAYKRGARQTNTRIMLSAHMDEVGFIITSVDDGGFLRFTTVGGMDKRILPGKGVEIGDGCIYGVIGAKSLHHLEDGEKDEPLTADKLYIDIGASDRQDALKHVQPGDRAVFSAKFTRLGDEKILGRAFDDRAGCAILISLIRSDLPCDCAFAFTTQEETGSGCAGAAAFGVEPDVSIVVEATTASDIAGVEPDMVVCEQGKGAVISFMDSGAIYDGGLYELAFKTASDNGIPCQAKAGVFGANDSRAIHSARSGVRSMAVSLPCRYIHTAGNVLDIGDIRNTLKLLEKLIPAIEGM